MTKTNYIPALGFHWMTNYYDWLDGYENTIDNINGLLPGIIEEAGFSEVIETKKYNTVIGTLSLLKARNH